MSAAFGAATELRMARRRAERVIQSGGVVVRRDDGRQRVLLVRSSDGQRWLFPKGHVKRGESLGHAAVREVREESGVVAAEKAFVGRARFTLAGRRVEVYYYLLEHHGEVAASEDRDIHWCTRAEARRLLSFEQLNAVLDSAWAASRVVFREPMGAKHGKRKSR